VIPGQNEGGLVYTAAHILLLSEAGTMRHTIPHALATLFTAVVLTSAPSDVAAQTVAEPAVVGRAAAASQHEVASSVQDFVGQAIDDFRRIPSWQNLAILTAGGIGATLGHTMDDRVSDAMSKSTGLGGLLQTGEVAGGARTQFAAAVATYTLGRVIGSGKVSEIGADLIGAQIVTQSMTAAIKLSVGRTRPDGTQYSFPSGHASVTFATATVLQRHLGWKAGVPAYGLATYVAASRVHDKRHFLSDVTFGAALGIVAGRSVTVGTGDARFAISPAPTPGGGAVSFTWLGAK
jgi:membrane-associated phospholipid phosphatase